MQVRVLLCMRAEELVKVISGLEMAIMPRVRASLEERMEGLLAECIASLLAKRNCQKNRQTKCPQRLLALVRIVMQEQSQLPRLSLSLEAIGTYGSHNKTRLSLAGT